MANKLPSLSQAYFDDNRERFNAETTEAPLKNDSCSHYFIRITPQEVGCERCTAVWQDNGGWVIEKGSVLRVVK